MINFFRHVVDVAQKKTTVKKRRSRFWRSVRKKHIKANPTCAACGTRKRLEVHHMKPFALYPELELDRTNLQTLCQRDHFAVGHLYDYRAYNYWSLEDARQIKNNVNTRLYK